jgi:hypothetical protein
LLLVELREGDDPGRWFIAAAACGFVQAEGLERAGEGEEEQRRGDEDAEIEMRKAGVFEEGMCGRHASSIVLVFAKRVGHKMQEGIMREGSLRDEVTLREKSWAAIC